MQSGGAEIAQATITLLRELEGSIQASQRALLSRDLAGLEQRSHEQIGLLEILWSRVAAHSIDPTGPILESQEDRSRDALPQARDLALAAELRSAEMRVLHLGRVQAALLVRAQRWLNILSNLIAGPEASYAAPTCNRASEYAARPADSSQEEAEEGDRCRV